MKFLHTQNTLISRFGIFSVFLICCIWFLGSTSEASAQEAGDGIYFYGITGDTMPHTKEYDNSLNIFNSTSTTVTGDSARISVIKASPTTGEMVAGYVTSAGDLYVTCFDGATWTNEWSVNIGGTGTTRRFDIGYESDTGDVMVLYSSNAATTNELKFRTKSGSAACGSGNWSGENNLDPVRTTGIVQWVKIAEDRRATSTLMTAIWADANRDLSAMVWSGTAWGNEHTSALEATLEVASAAQDVESFDVAYESVSGDVMVVWGSGGTNGTNGAYYAVCTGGTDSCTWTGVRTAMPTFLDDATHISIAADPLSDQIVFASVGNAGADLQRGIWSGSAWTNTANADTSAAAPTAGRMFVATGWLNNSATKRAVITYYDSAATNIGWQTANGTTWTNQTDVTPTTAFGTQVQYKVDVNPLAPSELMFTVSNSIQRGFGKRLVMDSSGVFTWTEPDGGILTEGLSSTIYKSADFAYWRSLPAIADLSGTVYQNHGYLQAGEGLNVIVAVATTTYSATTSVGGLWSVEGIIADDVSTTTPITIFVNGTTTKATTIVSGYESGSISNIPLHGGKIVAYGAANESVIELSNFSMYDNSDNPDVLFSASSSEFVAHAPLRIERGEVIGPDNLVLEMGYQNNASFTTGAAVEIGGYLGDLVSAADISGASTGTESGVTYAIAEKDNFIFVAKSSSATACSQTPGSAIGCELQVYDATDLDNPVYVAGRDASGSNSGTASQNIMSLAVQGDYLYVTKEGNGTACSQTPGSAIGCEIMVFNIINPANPTYIAGRDVTGDDSGTGSSWVYDVAAKQGVLVIGKAGDTTACSQTPGSAIGCELQVYDISTPTNPTYVAGRDTSGSAAGTSAGSFDASFIEGDYVYVVKAGDTTACSQTPGSAIGCELQVYDISTPTNPTYVAGRDSSGNATGTSNTLVRELYAEDNYLYVAKSGTGIACSQTPGSANGCELQVYDISTPTNPTYVAGQDASGSAAGTGSNAADYVLKVGNYLYLVTDFNSTDCSQTPGSAIGCELQVYDISTPTNPTYVAGRDSSGSLTSRPSMNSSASFLAMVSVDNRLFLAGTGDDEVPCQQVAGLAGGCELQQYKIAGEVSGFATGTNALGDTTVTKSGVYFRDDASVGDLIMTEGVMSVPEVLTVNGNLNYTGGLLNISDSEVVLAGTNKDVIGNFTGENTFNTLRVTGSYEITASNASTTNLFIEADGTLTAPATLSVERRMHNDGTFDNNNGTVLLGQTDTNIGEYAYGISKRGSVDPVDGAYGDLGVAIMVGNYMYVGVEGYEFPCSQTPDAANECSLLVFDMTDPDVPVLVYSLSGGGSTGGSTGGFVVELLHQGNYVYVGKKGNSTACSQSAGSAVGCEIMVLDVSNPAVPVYVAGRDASGSAAGTASKDMMSLAFYNNHLYVGTYPDSTACSQSAGSAEGCEIMVFDVTDPTDPTYVAGRDGDASADGTTGPSFEAGTRDMEVIDNYLYVARAADGECYVVAGQAEGCALQIYDISTGSNPTLVGTLTSRGQITDPYAFSEFWALAVLGDYLYVGKAGEGRSCVQGTEKQHCEVQVYDISSTTNPVFVSGIDMSGDASGGAGYPSGVIDLEVADDYLYVVTSDVVESCLPIAGSAVGCYVKIFDIASGTDPVLVSARDTFGTYGVSKENNRSEPRDIMVYDNRVFVTYFESGTFCSDGMGGFYSCGMSVFEAGTAGVVTGQFTGDSSLGDVVTYGTTVIDGVASTSDLTIAGDIFNMAPTTLTVGGNLERAAGDVLFSANATLEFISNSAQTVSGDFTGLATLPNLYFAGSGTKTVSDTATTSHVTIAAGTPVTFESLVEVKGALYNAGTFSTEAGLTLSGLYENTGSTDIETELTIHGSPIVGLVGGIDGSGQVLGTGREVFNDVVVNGDYLYTAKRGSGDCASNLSEGIGCHLQVFDISDPANMLYVQGIANTGGYDFTYGDRAYALATEGNYLYVGRQQNGDTCQNASLQLGCEIVVYDISSSTDLVFAAGRDSDGALLGTTDSTAVLVLQLANGYLYVGKEGNSTACSQSAGSAVGCEIMVFDVTDPTDPVYVAGIDVGASATGDLSQHIVSIEVVGDYLYVGTEGNDTACSQSAGSAIGCELLVFDVTDPTDPVYVAGRDSDGTGAGTRSAALYSLKGDGTYLYAGYNSDYGDCDETTQETCELKIYDISSSTTPSLVGGTRGLGRPVSNTAGPSISAIEIYGNILYIGKQPSGTGCNTWMPDTDLGPCELIAFDISSSTNPLYLDARDVSGGGIGTHDFGIYAMALGDGYLYTVIRPQFDNAADSPCIPVAGSAEGCDIQVYDIHHTLSGSMTGTNAFPDTTIAGVGAEFVDNATTRAITFGAGETIAPAVLTVSGDFIHNTNGTFVANGGEVILNGADQNVVGTTTFFDLTKQAAGAATTTFETGSLTTVLNDWTFSGASAGVTHVLRSSVDSEYWYINASNTIVSNLAVEDSNNLNVTTIVCGAGCIDNTGNVNWSFEEVFELSILSSAPHTFYFGQATTSLGSVVITEGGPETITTTNDIRIRIATSTTNLRFDTATTELSFGGTAAGKASETVSYEQGGAVLVIDVTTNFAAGETLVIDGVKVGSFLEASAGTSVLSLYTNGGITGEPAALDTQPIRILGGLILEDHPEGQVSNQFSALNVEDTPLFAFTLQTIGEETLVEDLTLSLLGLGELTTENILNFRLYRDNNSDRELDGGDSVIDGAGIFTINGQNGAVTFSTNFTASTSVDYLIVADTFAISKGASANFTLTNTALVGVGSISGITPVLVSTVSTIQHIRPNAGTTGGSVGVSRVGGSAPAGASTETGGASGGGAPVGQTDGENIASETDFYKPTTSGALDDEWTNGANALLSDGNYASAASTNLRQSYSGFPFAIPSGNSIQGIGIKIDASGSTPAGTIDVALTWDNGETYTTGKVTPTLVGADLVYMIGGPADLWGRTWSASDFASGAFRVRVTATTDNNTLRLDAIEVLVYHQTTGGSSGGGGGGRS